MIFPIMALSLIIIVVTGLWLYIEYVDNQQHEMYQEYARKMYEINHRPKIKDE